MYKARKLDLVILAGGKGARISKYLKGIPKPMIKFKGIPFLQYQINKFFKYPFINCYILSGYRGKIIEKKYNNKTINFIKIKNFIEKKPQGTGGSLKRLKNVIKNDFLLVNGDSIFDISLDEIFFSKNLKKNLITMYLTENKNYKSNTKLSNLSVDSKNLIKFTKNSKLMNAGIYLCKKKLINFIDDKIFSFENDLLDNLIKRKKIQGILKKNYFIDIGIPKKLIEASKIMTNVLKKPAVFLDRDGVINYDYGYVHKYRDFKFKKGILSALRELIKKNYYIFIITNQAGIGKKIFKENDFFNLHKKLKFFLAKKNIYIDDVQYCPFHPQAKIKKFRKVSKYRKPNNGMIEDIKKKWNIDFTKSFFIGDQKNDMLTAKKSGIYFEYVQNNPLLQVKRIIEDMVKSDLRKIK